MHPNASVARRSVLCLILGMAAITLNYAYGQDKVMPMSGNITLIRSPRQLQPSRVEEVNSPRQLQPSRVEEVNLASGEIKQLVQASPERPSIRSFCFSADRKQCLFEMGSGANWYENNEIYLGNTNDGSVRRVTDNGIYDGDPAWSLDGVRFAFTRGWGVKGHVYLRELASGEERPLSTAGLIITRHPHWLTEGTLLLYGFDSEERQGLVVVHVESGSVRWLLKDQVGSPCLSPDRKRLACVVQKRRVAWTMEQPECLYSVNILTLDTRTLKPLDHEQSIYEKDVCPIWSHDGKKLTWIRNDQQKKTCKLVIHDVETGGTTSIPLPDADAGSLVWAPDDSAVVYVSRDRHPTKDNLRLLVLSTGTIRDIFSTADQIKCLYWQ